MSQPGLEILLETVSQQIKCREDTVMCVLHWNVVSKGFKCTGIEESRDGSPKKSELLPEGWNKSKDLYVLRYHHTQSNEDFVLKVVRVDDCLLVHFMRSKDEKVTSINIRVANYTTGELKEFDRMFKNLEELEKRITSDVLKDFQRQSKQDTPSSSQTQTQQSRPRSDDDDPLRVPCHRQQSHPEWMPSRDPFGVGRGDLDPLGGGMGGMLMDPRRSGAPGFGPDAGLPGRLPRGVVPPGARFDPFSPPGAGPSGPNPDHMRPPDYDDMFM